jgi:hypothetical protein
LPKEISVAVVEYDFSFDHMLHYEGKKFFDAVAVLKEHPVHYSNSPYYVLLAFSIELMLKSLRVKKTITTSKSIPSKINSMKVEHVKGHALIGVYNEHPQELKNWLSESILREYAIDLEDILSQHANLFNEARCIYPKNVMEGGSGYTVNKSALYCVGSFMASIPDIMHGNYKALKSDS